MNTLIKAVETWLPTPDGSLLEFGGGLYGRATAFGAISRALCFGRGEGLPGRAWFDARPIVLKELDGSYFRRAEVAREAGFTCAIGLPFFLGEALTGVVVFFCGPDSGQGDEGAAVLVDDHGATARFTGMEGAAEAGFPRGLAMPCAAPGEHSFVLRLLPTPQLPVALRMECWAPDESRHGLQRMSGFCERAGPLRASDGGTVLAGAIGKAFASGVPVINAQASNEPGHVGDAARHASLQSLVALPVVTDGVVSEVVALYF